MLFQDRIFYHIYPLGLCGAPEKNDAAPLTEEDDAPFFAVGEAWADHMQTLGCNAVYIGPLFESTSHGYDTRDYRRIDRRLGNNAGFRRWVDACGQYFSTIGLLFPSKSKPSPVM